MKTEEINAEIAKACGRVFRKNEDGSLSFFELEQNRWVGIDNDPDARAEWYVHILPNYHGSLDAMREPLSKLTEAQKLEFGEHAATAFGYTDDWYEGWQMGLSGFFDLITLPPEKISEIYVRTIGKWRDG